MRGTISSPRVDSKLFLHGPRFMTAPPTVPTAPRTHWMTVANVVTLVRVAAIPMLVVSVLRGAAVVAAGLFALAVVTDMLDGRVARRRGEVSRFGGLLDHSADALLCSSVLGALAFQGLVPGPLPFLVAAAFLQYVLDSKSLAGMPLRASVVGRSNGIFYFALVGTPIVRDALGLAWPGTGLVRALGWVLVASTLVSMLDRLVALVARRAR